MQLDSAESAGGRLGAVLTAPRSGLAPLGASGPWLATTPALARRVLTDVSHFDFPGDVSRSDDLSASRGDTRSGHVLLPSPSPEQVAVGTAVFAEEWLVALAEHDRLQPGKPYDAMVLLRRPVARSTAAAVLSGVSTQRRNVVADLVLTWIDALAPVISARRPPGRWSRTRRIEHRARLALEDTLGATSRFGTAPGEAAVVLAAGTQVPIAAGAWLIAHLGAGTHRGAEPVHVVWETLRLTPPTWVTARITTGVMDLDGRRLPAGAVVMVSPLLLGRLPSLVPGDEARLDTFDPHRWRDERRPGAWLPFGAGPHACPGRNLGMTVLTHLASWASLRDISLVEQVRIDQSRGLAPLPCRFTVAAGRETLA